MASHSSAVARRSASRSKTREAGVAGTLRPGHPAVLVAATTGALVLIGLLMILSASSVESFATYGTSFVYFKKQLIWAGAGILGFVVFAFVDYRRWRNLGYLAFAVTLILLLAVIIPGVGVTVGGSARWLAFGPLQFQPSELAKLALILFLADVFSRKREELFDTFAHTMMPLIPALGILGLFIMKQPDLGTAMILGLIGIGMVFIAGGPVRYIAPTLAVGGLLATALALAEPYRRARVLTFLHPFRDPFNTGMQTVQSLIAVGSGGWFGVGLGASRQKWSRIPNAHTDFIFAIFAEETGLFGSVLMIGLFAFLAYLGVRTAHKAPDRYGLLVASGITMWLALQAVINIGAVTASLPITGVPLPLVSFGGTSLLISLIAMGILTNIAYQGATPTTSRGTPTRSKRRR
ncbi:MAG: putative lipid II flippase FtsW [Actinobacteria bacterium]|nr:putative lipid II flippase FtsW [Actinomycetota bacterium]